ncbi:MAG: alkaline phosphatase family protein [Candidatus Cybelea sp.]
MRITNGLLAVGLTATLATAGCTGGSMGSGTGTPSVGSLSPASGTSAYIQHVVIVVQENRSFDDFFATFPGAVGATQGLEKTPSGDQYIQLQSEPLDSLSLAHQHLAFNHEYDHGKMDGFNTVALTLHKGTRKPAGTYAYRYVDPADIPEYWDIAGQYVLGDHMFTTQSSDSFTAHQDLIAAGTPVGDKGDNVIDFPTPSSWGCDASPPGTTTSLITPSGRYRKAKGPFPCFTYSTIRDLLDAKSLSWLYFTNTSKVGVWNPFEAIQAVRDGPEWSTNIIQPETQFFNYVTNGELPAVSWVIPDAVDSDHPGNHSDSGPSWVASIVNAIGESAYWPNTAVIVVWDDWGGEYDNVPPPQLDGQGLGIRVPMLLVSAYARETSSSQAGYISHTQYEFGSILKFMEQNWGLGTLGRTDVRANSLIDCFDFTQPPRTFSAIPAKYSKAYFLKRPPSGLPVDDY